MRVGRVSGWQAGAEGARHGLPLPLLESGDGGGAGKVPGRPVLTWPFLPLAYTARVGARRMEL